MREQKDANDIVGARLRAVLTAPEPEPVTAAVPTPAGPFDDHAPLRWSDVIPSWPDDVDLPEDDPPDELEVFPATDDAPAAHELDQAAVRPPAPAGALSADGLLVDRPQAGQQPGSGPWLGRPRSIGPRSSARPDELSDGASDPTASSGSYSTGLSSTGSPSTGSYSTDSFAAGSSSSAGSFIPRPSAVGPFSTGPLVSDGEAEPAPHPDLIPAHDGIPQWTYVDDQPDDEQVLSNAGAFSGRSAKLSLFDPGRRGVRALAAVALAVVIIAAIVAWRARPRADAVDVPPIETRAAAALDGGGGGAGPAAARSSVPAELVVAVGGKVRKPGLVRLPPGARVADALEAAGGAEPGVDVTALNLARKVVDGELIMVGATPPPGAVPPGGGAGGPAAGPTAGGPINLNTATLADLDSLPGVGPVLAQRILDARTAQGGFRAVSDLRKVDGIGDSRYEQLKDLVTV